MSCKTRVHIKLLQAGEMHLWTILTDSDGGRGETWTCCNRQHNIFLLMHMIFELMGLKCGENSVLQGCPDPWCPIWFLYNQKVQQWRGDGSGCWICLREMSKQRWFVPGKNVCHLVANPWIMYCKHQKTKPSWYKKKGIWLSALPSCPGWNQTQQQSQLNW